MSNGLFLRPADGRITSKAGPRWGRIHGGVDIGAQYGWNVRAMFRGTVTSVVHHAKDDWRVNIQHQGFFTRYLHLASVSVKVGDKITGDSPAARIFAKTGIGGVPPYGGPHVHVEIHPGSVWRGTASADIDWINDLLLDTPTDGSSNPRNRSTPSRNTGPAHSTTWPRQRLSNPFTANSNPFRSASGRPVNNWFDVVPGSHSKALYEAIRRAGYRPVSQSKWGHEELLRQRLRDLGYTASDPQSIWAAWQRYMSSPRGGNRYRGAIDGQPGAQTWWATTEWLNAIRQSYL